jgi:hypothetical protein
VDHAAYTGDFVGEGRGPGEGEKLRKLIVWHKGVGSLCCTVDFGMLGRRWGDGLRYLRRGEGDG